MFKGSKIARCRKSMGWSQEDMIASLAVQGYRISRQTLTNWERGKTFPDANDIVYLCRLFGKSVLFWFGNYTKAVR